MHLHSVGVVELDLDTVPDVLGLTGRRPEVTVIRVLQGRDEWSVRALIPDSRFMERGFHDVTIVDMGDSPEPSLFLDDLSQLRLQWPVTVLRCMVCLQQDLDSMRAAANTKFPYKICTDMWRHIIWIWPSCGGARCPGAPCGRARRRTAWITSEGYMMCRGTLNQPIWRIFVRRGLFSAIFGRMSSKPAIRGCSLTCCCSARIISHWSIITESSSMGCRILHFRRTISHVSEYLCHRQRHWHSVIWRPGSAQLGFTTPCSLL